MGKVRTFGAGIFGAALALSGCAPMGASPDSNTLVHGRYVAMGSSMAAGPGLGEIKPGTPARCSRAFANYPTMLAEKLQLTLVDVTCGGATTEHVLGPWNELPAQIDAVTSDTTLVTVTIGGNDLNYVGGLMTANCDENGKFTYQGQSYDCPPKRQPTEVDYAIVEENLGEIANQVRQRAPKARLVFVQYLRLVPETLCDKTAIGEEDAATGRNIAQRLADVTASVAKRSGARLVPVHDWSASFTPCAEEPFTNGNQQAIAAGDGMVWHPTRAGMAGVASWIETVLER